MRLSTIAIIVLATAAALYMAREFAADGRNIEERTAYWEKELSASLKPGASREDIEAFATAHGEQLDCYQNYDREDKCDFTDSKSAGGSSGHPMKLTIIFTLKEGRLVSHELTTTLANAPR
jgi:hypothetical protein